MAERSEWDQLTRQILDTLDVEAEYRSFGLKFTTRAAAASGWKECHAIDREDDHASAAANVGSGPARGRYKDLGGSGLHLSFFDFAARFGGKGADWREARKHYAQRCGVPLPRGAEPKNPLDALLFRDWFEASVRIWCEAKGGITVEAVRDAGGTLADWPKAAPVHLRTLVVAFPGYGAPALLDGDPCAWVIMNATGESLSVFQGKGKAPAYRKIQTVGGSTGGLMNAFALARLASAEIVWKCEGVSDMLALHGAIAATECHGRHVVITNSGGCQESVRPEWIALLAGKRVCVLHDADRPGQIGAAKWVDSLEGKAEVRNIVLPYEVEEKHGKDVRDWLREGHAYAELFALAEATAPAKGVEVLQAATGRTDDHEAGPITDERQLLVELQLDVLGEHRQQSVEVFSAHRRKLSRIPNVGRLSYADLLQICGEPARDKVDESKDPEIGKYTLSQVRNAIAFEGGKHQLSDGMILGAGLWSVEVPVGVNGHARPVQQIVLVDADRAGIWDGERFAATTTPRVGSQVLEFAPGERWCDFDAAVAAIEGQTGQTAAATLAEAEQLFAKWNWCHPLDARLMAALVCATWVQTIWPWRPLVSLSGPSDSGKTTLLEVLQKLFGQLSLAMSKSTEAGIRQALRSTARVLMLDEFENDQHRAKVLELLRTSSKGTSVLRGTSDQFGRRYGLKHIVWVAAIETGLSREPDRNRFVTLELRRPEDGKRGNLELPNDEGLADLGRRLLGVAVRHIGAAVRLANLLKGVKVPEVPGRSVECYAVPASLWAAVLGLSDAQAVEVLKEMLSGVDTEQPRSHDEHDLLRTILGSIVNVGGGRSYSVRQIMSMKGIYEMHYMDLERCGIALARESRGPKPIDPDQLDHVFILPSEVQRHLLRGTRWAEGDIESVLRRLPGAMRCQRHISDTRESGILIPKKLVKIIKSEGRQFTNDDGQCDNEETIEVS